MAAEKSEYHHTSQPPAIGLGLSLPPSRPENLRQSSGEISLGMEGDRGEEPNLLGLEGVGSGGRISPAGLVEGAEGWVAPDCDGAGEVVDG